MTPKEKIAHIAKAFNADERETSILFDHKDDVVHLETTEPFTARRWLNLIEQPGVQFDKRSDSFKIRVPSKYCRKPELILMAKYRTDAQRA